MMLCEYQVPMLRAAWFIKLSSAYTTAVSEAKMKKRQLPDPTQGLLSGFGSFFPISQVLKTIALQETHCLKIAEILHHYCKKILTNVKF